MWKYVNVEMGENRVFKSFVLTELQINAYSIIKVLQTIPLSPRLR